MVNCLFPGDNWFLWFWSNLNSIEKIGFIVMWLWVILLCYSVYKYLTSEDERIYYVFLILALIGFLIILLPEMLL